jgi:Lon protease-like protein
MELLPLFPLGITVLPGQETMLHIFEPRYKELFADCVESDILFGIPYVKDGELTNYGVTAKLKRIITRYKSGELDVMIKGIDVFRIEEYMEQHPEKSYPAGKVNVLATDIYEVDKKLAYEFKSYAFKYLDKSQKFATRKLTIYQIAANLNLTENQKFDLITQFDIVKMNRMLVNTIRINSALNNQEINLQGNFYLN